MTHAVQQALRLVSGALGAVSFDQLVPGVLVNDELGRFYGIVLGQYVSPAVDFHASDVAALMVLVWTSSGDMVISGRYLEPLVHGPADPLAGYDLLLRQINPKTYNEMSWRERNRP